MGRMSERLLQRRLLIGLGLGIGLGAAAASLAMYLLRTRYGVSSEIGQLAAKIDCLQREVHELRTSVEFPDLGAEDSPDTLQLSRPDSFFSLPGSSDDEEDEFLDSYDV
ncbi:hypothetical protein CAPTEDRAFT_214934 [Capitella teleta]|nr:hypothetical protein CAPTEDRAFT_214934 [Capitella teleta]|eukprot:ELU01052.1 hypothetical protein CAPTEDRAFT_214934 [Capitella teleta]